LSEVEQLKNIARFYDEEELQRQSSETFEKLRKEQRHDGGWPWMPGGRHSSTYVTQHILKGYGMMARQMSRGITPMETRALAYVDKEAYKDYLDWQNGVLAQVAFPYLSANEREALISGICPTCWEKMFGGDDDE
jgi:hypothetical protein